MTSDTRKKFERWCIVDAKGEPKVMSNKIKYAETLLERRTQADRIVALVVRELQLQRLFDYDILAKNLNKIMHSDKYKEIYSQQYHKGKTK